MSFGAIAVGTIGGIVSMVNAGKNRELAEDQLKEARLQRQEQQARLDRQKAEYKSMQLTVNQQQAQFEAQQGAQQRANIMQSLKGAAGASGIAGLAQALANQGQLQTQRISASIGQQESRNQMAAAKGASAIQIAERQGDQFIQQAEMDRQATLLGMQMGVTTGANLGFQQAQANQMNAMIQQQQSMMDFIGGLAEPVGDAFGNISLPERKKKQKGKS